MASDAGRRPEPAHVPVLLDEVLGQLAPCPGEVMLDGTLGAGGHAAALLARLGETGHLYGVDRDPVALALAGEALGGPATAPPRATLIRGAYADAPRLLPADAIERGLDGILLDLGLSSMQLDDPARGFGFRAGGPLDMRMDPAAPTRAADLLRDLDAPALEALLRDLGEERRARAVAAAIVSARDAAPIDDAARLADIVRGVLGRARPGQSDPATRVFQALRIAVNDELGQLEAALPALASLLAPGGRFAVISFHSLEDRIVKRAFRELAAGEAFELPFRKPLTPGRREVARNPRSRSAKLRVLRARRGVTR